MKTPTYSSCELSYEDILFSIALLQTKDVDLLLFDGEILTLSFKVSCATSYRKIILFVNFNLLTHKSTYKFLKNVSVRSRSSACFSEQRKTGVPEEKSPGVRDLNRATLNP